MEAGFVRVRAQLDTGAGRSIGPVEGTGTFPRFDRSGMARSLSRAELLAEFSQVEPIDVGESAEQALAHIRDDLA